MGVGVRCGGIREDNLSIHASDKNHGIICSKVLSSLKYD